MLPYLISNLFISEHAVDRFAERTNSQVKDPIKIRTIIKDYLAKASDYDIFEAKDGNYYVKYFEEKPKDKKKDLYFIVSKDSTVMTIKPVSIEQAMHMMRK